MFARISGRTFKAKENQLELVVAAEKNGGDWGLTCSSGGDNNPPDLERNDR